MEKDVSALSGDSDMMEGRVCKNTDKNDIGLPESSGRTELASKVSSLCVREGVTGEAVDDLDQLRGTMKSLHCPFTWEPHNLSCWDVVGSTEKKLNRIEDEDEVLNSWTKFILNLILCFEYSQSRALSDAFEKQEECHKILNSDGSSNADDNSPVMGVGLKHVSLACRVHLLYKSQQYAEAIDVVKEIPGFHNMENVDQASIWSIRGALFMEYGLGGIKSSVNFIEKAIELDPNCAEWYFLLGKSLARARRIEDRCCIPDEKELKALETAVNKKNNASYMVLLAHSYMDASRQTLWNAKKNEAKFKPVCDALNKKALDMYRNAFETSGNNLHILERCALGFMRLPSPWKDLDLFKKCLNKGLEMDANNTFLNHTAGMYFLRTNDLDEAENYCIRAVENGSYGASLDLLTIRLRKDGLYNPVPDIERYLEHFKEKPHQERLWAMLGFYYYFTKNDFKTALRYWNFVIESNIFSKELKAFFVAWAKPPYICNINRIIIKEIIKNSNVHSSETEQNVFAKIMDEYLKYHPGLVKCVQKEERN